MPRKKRRMNRKKEEQKQMETLQEEELGRLRAMADLADERPRLRFHLHDRVECSYNDPCTRCSKYASGTIVQLWYREEEWPAKCVAPYQIRLDDSGALIYAPFDEDGCIRAERGCTMHTRLESNAAASTSHMSQTTAVA